MRPMNSIGISFGQIIDLLAFSNALAEHAAGSNGYLSVYTLERFIGVRLFGVHKRIDAG